MSGIAGIARSNTSSEVNRMLDEIAYRGTAGREFIETRGTTVGIVYHEHQESFAKCLCKNFTVRDGTSGNFAQAQAKDSRLWLMRDAAGVVPLYYGKTERGELCFASEVKALSLVTCDLHEFPPGHFFDGVKLYPWSVTRETPQYSDTNQVATTEFYDRLIAAIRESVAGYGQEIGVFLSGGLGSSAIAAFACRLPHCKTTTFTIGLPGAPDIEAARTVANFLGTRHYEIIVSGEELVQALSEVIYYLESFEVQLVRSSVLHYLAAKKAAEWAPVILVGDGADSLFAHLRQNREKTLHESNTTHPRPVKHRQNNELLRVDRCGAAHGLTSAAPFLNYRLVDFSTWIPPELELPDRFVRWFLREALASTLPESILHRPQKRFWEGGGVGELLAEWAEECITPEEFAQERTLANGWTLDSPEELLYYRLFRGHFGEMADNPTWVGRTAGIRAGRTDQKVIEREDTLKPRPAF